MAGSLIERTVGRLRLEGYVAQNVEQWIPAAMVRRDLFNFGDILAMRPEPPEILILQVTSWANVSSRLHKIRAEPKALTWLQAGGLISVWGWKSPTPQCRTYQLRTESVTLADFTVEGSVHADSTKPDAAGSG